MPLLEQESLVQVSILEIVIFHESWRQPHAPNMMWFTAHFSLHILERSHPFFKRYSHSLNWMPRIPQNTIQHLTGSEYSQLPDVSLAVKNRIAYQILQTADQWIAVNSSLISSQFQLSLVALQLQMESAFAKKGLQVSYFLQAHQIYIAKANWF